jgi:hypothetical protein
MLLSELTINALVLPRYHSFDPYRFAIDACAWLGFLLVALRAQRFWPLWVSAFQTTSLVAHVAKLLDISIHPVAYLTMQVGSSYPLLIILAIATYLHQKRLCENGSDPSWRP